LTDFNDGELTTTSDFRAFKNGCNEILLLCRNDDTNTRNSLAFYDEICHIYLALSSNSIHSMERDIFNISEVTDVLA